MKPQHMVIFANGELSHPDLTHKLAQSAEYIIAADGGLEHIFTLGLTPNLLIGDLDSVTSDQVMKAEELGCEVIRYPVEKDETDLELALLKAVQMGLSQITIVTAFGGRLDQSLANISLLSLPELADVDVRIDDGIQEVFLIRSGIPINGGVGDTVSLLPLTPNVSGVSTSGLKYPLSNETLFQNRSRGISNEMLSGSASVDFKSGILLCVHTRKEKE